MTDNNVDNLLEEINALTSAKKSNGNPPTSENNDVMAQLSRAAETCREVGRYANEHGRYVEEISVAFAVHLEQLMNEYSSKIIEAERLKMGELQRMIGK